MNTANESQPPAVLLHVQREKLNFKSIGMSKLESAPSAVSSQYIQVCTRIS